MQEPPLDTKSSLLIQNTEQKLGSRQEVCVHKAGVTGLSRSSRLVLEGRHDAGYTRQPEEPLHQSWKEVFWGYIPFIFNS